MTKHSRLPAPLLCLLLLMVVFEVASATTVTKTYTNYVGSSDAKARVQVDNVSASYWVGRQKSHMESPSVVINVIGRRWWTVREYCEDWQTHSWSVGGAYWTASGYTGQHQVSKTPCANDQLEGRSVGQHDFNDNEAPGSWTPENDTGHIVIN